MRAVGFAALLLLAVLATVDAGAEPVMKNYFVERSHAIVVGRLTDARVRTVAGVDHGSGAIVVEQVLIGPLKTSARVPLTWRHSAETARMCPPSFDFRQVEQRQGVWFVELRPTGELQAMTEVWLVDNEESLDEYLRLLPHLPGSERMSMMMSFLRSRRAALGR